MKQIGCFLIMLLILFSCKEDKVKIDVETINVEPTSILIERFDKAFYQSKPENLHQLKKQYPYLFPKTVEDSVWIHKIQDKLWQELYEEAQKKFSDDEPLKVELADLFARIQYFFPNETTPTKVITLINEVDRKSKVIYTDSIVLISLDCYLGEEHRFYEEFPAYQRIGFNKNQIMPDLVQSFSLRSIPYPKDNALLSQMIYYGKQHYLKDVLLPNHTDSTKINYNKIQLKWCQENEAQIWSYFIENELLFDTNPKNNFRFINEAPFSKFYLEIDNESPGRLGQWLGWQIVRSFMQNNNVSLPEMLKMDTQSIFENSKYKPNK